MYLKEMLVKRRDIVYMGVLFKRYSREAVNAIPDFCSRCIYYNQYCRAPRNFLGGPYQSCRLFDTPEFMYIPRGYVKEEI